MKITSTEIVLNLLKERPYTARAIIKYTGLGESNVKRILNILENASVLETTRSERTGEKIYLSKRRCSSCKRVIASENKEIKRLRSLIRTLKKKNAPEPMDEANRGGALEAQ